MPAKTTAPALTADQAATVGRARALLGEPHGHDAADLAYRLGRVEFYLGDLLALVATLTSDAR